MSSPGSLVRITPPRVFVVAWVSPSVLDRRVAVTLGATDHALVVASVDADNGDDFWFLILSDGRLGYVWPNLVVDVR